MEKDGRKIILDFKTKSAKWELPKPGSRLYGDWTDLRAKPRWAPTSIC